MRSESLHRLRLFGGTCFFNLFLLTHLAAAGQGTSASIIGQVRDESGAVLPGVTVTAKSPALQVPEVMGITDERGEYRLTPLPIGSYAVDYELAGFQTVRQQNLRLTVGFMAKVDVVLKVGALAETITVSGAAPVVDVTGTGTSTLFTRETLELIPTSRNGIVGLLAQAPGVRGNLDVGGNSMSDKPYARSFGQAGEANYFIEGVFTNELSGGNYWDYSTIEEARVQTVGNTADVPSRGVNINAMIKSGGNDYHGTAMWSQISPALQSSNITPELRGQGITSGAKLLGRYDISSDLGGRIIQNKLWFYGALRRRTQQSEPLNAFKPDGSPATDDNSFQYYTGKLSYQMTHGNRFVGFFQRSEKEAISGASQLVAWESRQHLPTFLNIGKFEWQGVRGNSLFLSLQFGNWNQRSPFQVHSDAPPATDLTTLKVWGMNTSGGQRHSAHRHDPKGTVTWYRPQLLYGSHEFKLGGGIQYNAASRAYPDPPFTYRLIFNNGAPFQINAYNYPTIPTPRSETFYAYASDSLTMGRRLTLNVGLRYSHDNGYVKAACQDAADPPGDLAFPAGCYPKVQWKVWRSVAPRLFAAYDVSGNGRTVLKGGWGRFDHIRGLEPELQLTDPKGGGSATYRWVRDLNGNNDYDAGEVNLDPNGPDFVSSNTGAVGVLNPNEKQPKTDEFSLSFERELAAELAVRIVGVYSRTVNTFRLQNNLRPYGAYNVALTRPDPGPDDRVGTVDDPGAFITYYEFPAELAGRRFEEFALINDRNADLRYKTVEIAGFKRFSGGWQFMASYAATKVDVPVVAGPVQSNANAAVRAGDYNPNAEINQADRTWELTGKASGTYTFPYGLSLAGSLEHRSGASWARQVLFTGGRTIPSLVLNVEPIGTRRLPNTSVVDVRIEKTFRLLRGHKAAVRMNIYNTFNASTVTGLVMRSGSTFLRPITILDPRIAEFSASYIF